MSSFFAYLYRMRYIERWGLMRTAAPENLAEHTLDTAILAYALAAITRDALGLDGPAPETCAAAALLHDAPEILTGDLPTPVKYFNPEIARAYKAVERHAADKLIALAPEPLRGRIARDRDPPDQRVREVVHAADKLSAYLKCIEEGKSGNREFGKAEKQIRQSLEQMPLPALGYFLEQCLPAYLLSLDELE